MKWSAPAIVFLVLLLAGFLPAVQELAQDSLQLRSLPGFLLLGGLVYWAFCQQCRSWLIGVAGLLALALLSLLSPIQSGFQSLVGLKRDWVCEQLIRETGRQRYLVTHHTGYQVRVLAGQNFIGNPGACASTLYHVAIASPHSVKPRKQQLDITAESVEQSHQLLENRDGRVTLLFIPSLKVQAMDIPMHLAQNRLSLLPGQRGEVHVQQIGW